MPVVPIPDDWAGTEWACIMLEWPNSPQWLGILRGLVTTPLRGRFWDGSTGTITDAQAIGLEIEERNPVSSCDEIVAQLELLVAAVDSLDVSQDLQVAIQTNIQNNISVVATAIAESLATQSGVLVAASASSAVSSAQAFAWSQSMAQNLLGVTIINNTPTQFRPIEVGVDTPPAAEEATPTGITDVLEDTAEAEICRRVYWLVRNAKEFYNHLFEARSSFANTVLGIMGAASDALWVASLKADPASKRFIIPAAVILNFAHTVQSLFNDTVDPFLLLNDWINDDYVELVCALVQSVIILDDTDTMKNIVLSHAINFGMSPSVASLALLFFNYSSLAALYYVSPLLDPAPAIPAFEPADICTFCLA